MIKKLALICMALLFSFKLPGCNMELQLTDNNEIILHPLGEDENATSGESNNPLAGLDELISNVIENGKNDATSTLSATISNLLGANGDDNTASVSEGSGNGTETGDNQEAQYKFRNNTLLTQHYEKHGIEMGFESKEDYERAASAVITNPDALHKTEKEDNDTVYYLEATNEFVILSTDGYIRTYFLPSAGKKYYDRQ